MNQHKQFLAKTLALAAIRRGFCSPNPAVGAVIVKQGELTGQGYHEKPGCAHAEVVAIQEAGLSARGATLYVSLEPCSHQGRTPPCTDAIIEAGIAKVYFAYADPNPIIYHQSAKKLQVAGVECEQMTLSSIDEFYQSYEHWTKYRKPYLTAKLTLSLDGKIAGKQGQPSVISGEEMRCFTHQKRLESDAILTTARTLNLDNPQLNVRLGDIQQKKNVYVLDSQLKLRKDLRIYDTANRITLFHRREASSEQLAKFEQSGVQCVAVDFDEQGLLLDQVTEYLGEQGLHDVWIEAGGQCFTNFLRQGLLNKAFICLSPRILGEEAYPALMSDDLLDHHCQWRQMGNDMLGEFFL